MLNGEKLIEESVQDDYSRILPVYKSSMAGTEAIATNNMNYAIEKSEKLLELHSITAKPKRRKSRSESYKKLAAKDEYNNWVDDSYILLGKSYFYMKDYIRATSEFDVVLRKYYHEPESYYHALIWLLRCYTEQERYSEATEVIAEIEGSMKFPDKLTGLYTMAAAQFYLEQGMYSEAIPQLETAIEYTKKKEKARCHFILGQLYSERANNKMAAKHFKQVTKSNVPYLMSFSAQLSGLVMSADSNNQEELKAELEKMRNNSRNENYLDQVYYALAKIEQDADREDAAIENYSKSVASYIENDNQLILSSLTLSELYFEREEYIKSRAYYDTLFSVLSNNHLRYEELYTKHQELINLTDNLLIIEREDSLQHLASLSTSERSALIQTWIEKRREQDRLADLAQQQLANTALLAQQINRSTQTSSSWYFYNPQTINLGRQRFVKEWGKRRLEDNWRRENKEQATFEDINEAEALATNSDSLIQEKVRIEDVYTSEYYTQDMPTTPEEWAVSNAQIIDALYKSARIFKEEYKNYPKAIEQYEELLERDNKNTYQLPVYFELWQLHNELANNADANQYKERILAQYPNSKYAHYIKNPNYFIELEQRKIKIEESYLKTVTLFTEGKYDLAARNANEILSMEPDSSLIPKIAFVQTVGDYHKSDSKLFNAQLSEYTNKYPSSELIPLADDIRALLQDSTTSLSNYQALLASGYISESISRSEDEEAKRANDAFGGKFSYDEDLIHYFLIAFDGEATIDANRLKFDIGNYNVDHYMKTDFDIDFEPLNPKTMMVTVKTLGDKEKALIYLRSIIRDRRVFKELDGIDYVNIVASTKNYREIKEQGDLTSYIDFYKKNYSKYTSNDFPDEELETPEELMEKLAQQEEKEQGSYVELDTKQTVVEETKVGNKDATSGSNLVALSSDELYFENATQPHIMVVAIKDDNKNMDVVLRSFTRFNSAQFSEYNLDTDRADFGIYQLIVIGKFSSAEQAMEYFRKAIVNRSLFVGLGNISYRNFIISSENYDTMRKIDSVDGYSNFFRSYYISGKYKNK